jgi:glutathione S-transferase
MKLFTTPSSSFVRKVTVTAHEIGIIDRIEIIPTGWPLNWGFQSVPFRPDFASATPIGRIPALVTDDGLKLCDSSVICEYLNAEFGDYTLCPQTGTERWRILALLSIANGLLEAQTFRRAEVLRKIAGHDDQYSETYVEKMVERQDRCFRAIDAVVPEFPDEPDLGQIAVAAACSVADFRWQDDWRPLYPNIASWYASFRERPSMLATAPVETSPSRDSCVETAPSNAGIKQLDPVSSACIIDAWAFGSAA